MKIPTYVVSVPEYKVKKLKVKDEETVDWFIVKVPKVYHDNRPDFKGIGAKIDVILKRHFLGKRVAIRVLGSQEHKGKTADELIRIIKKLGHDRYDSKRKGDRYENVENKRIDFFALDFVVKENGKYFEEFIEPFYFWPLVDRQVPVRIDVAIVYDFSKLKRVVHRYEGRKDVKKDGFVFKDENKKTEAILGIIKIK